MEQLSKIATINDGLVERSSNNGRIARPIPVEQQRAMGDVFDRWRINNGWNPWDDKTQMAAIASFVPTLDAEGIPPHCYNALYERMLKTRVALIQAGKSLPNFGVELLIAEWPGLKQDLHQRDIESGRLLTATAPTQCLRCYGTGLEQIYDEAGNKLGVREGCKHEYIDESDPSTAGIDEAINAVNRDETTLDICQRLKKSIVQDWVAAEDGDLRGELWRASGKIARVERYIRETASREIETVVNYDEIAF